MDEECKDGLICGTDNCQEINGFAPSFDTWTDCCIKRGNIFYKIIVINQWIKESSTLYMRQYLWILENCQNSLTDNMCIHANYDCGSAFMKEHCRKTCGCI